VARQVEPLNPATGSVMHTPDVQGCVALHCALQEPPVKPVGWPKKDSGMQKAPPGGWHCPDDVQAEPVGTGITAPPSGVRHTPATHRLPMPHG
jgi:hypothetical protein